MEGIMKLRQLLLACLMLSCTSVLAEDAYYHVPLASLTLSEGKLPASFEWGDSAWEMVEAVQPYAVLDGDGEAYVGGQSLQSGNPSDRAFQNMFLAIRAPNGGAAAFGFGRRAASFGSGVLCFVNACWLLR